MRRGGSGDGVVGTAGSRPTKDLDLLAHMDNAVGAVTAVMAEVCGQTVDADGLVLDVGSVAGEAIKEEPDYPALLDFAAPRLLGYPRETVVAEKSEAMTKLDLLNSRMKDCYDLWLLARQFDFDGPTLATAIRRTFENRKTAVASLPAALTPAFGSDAGKQARWQGTIRKSKLSDVPTPLQAVVDAQVPFLSPVPRAVECGAPFDGRWVAPGPWQSLG